MLKLALLILISHVISFTAIAQVEEDSGAPQISEQKIERIPEKVDDLETQHLLREMIKKAGWFPEIKVSVNHGIVTIKGRADDKDHVTWLAETAEKLPTVIAVINKAEIITPPITDMTPFFNETKKLINKAKKHLPRVGMGILIGSLFFFIGLKLHQFSRSLWKSKIQNVFLAITVARLFMLPVWFIFFYLTLMTIGLQSLAGTIVGGTGLLGVVLGFAFKGIAENYLSGLLLAIRSPFTKGDVVRIGDVDGIVQNLNMRGTTLLDFDGNLLLVPNIMVIQSVVKNKTVNPHKRSTFTIGVGLTESVKKCQDLIAEALESTADIFDEPAPMIYVEDLGISSINIRVYYWFDANAVNEANLKSLAMIKTKEILLANGIHLPDTYRERIMLDPANPADEKDHLLKSQAKKNYQEAKRIRCVDGDHDKEFQKIADHVSLPTQQGKDNLLMKH